MTRVDARADDRGQEAQVIRRNPYLSLLRTPGALAFSASGFVGRMSMSMYGLGTVLLIASITGRYGLAAPSPVPGRSGTRCSARTSPSWLTGSASATCC